MTTKYKRREKKTLLELTQNVKAKKKRAWEINKESINLGHKVKRANAVIID
jgi:hypothetical protein